MSPYGWLSAGAVGVGLVAGTAGSVSLPGLDQVIDRGRVPPALRATLEQDVVDGCLACHSGALSLADRDAEALVVMIDAMAHGRAEHAVPVPVLSADDVRALAAALADESSN